MFYVYCLLSEHTGKIYIGSTADLPTRLLWHNQLATKGFTLKFRPWKIAYHECCDSRQKAIAREKQLKSAAGRKFLRDLIEKKS